MSALIVISLICIIAVMIWFTRENFSQPGSKFVSKVNGRCPSGTVEIMYGGHKGECYKGGSSSRGSSSRGSSSRGSSSRGSGSTNYGSRFTSKVNGKCPRGTVEIMSGGRRGQCIKKKAGEYLSGSKYRNKENGRCPSGTVEITYGSRRGQCFIDDGGFKHWGWGQNQGKKCRNPDNTGCDDSYSYTKPRSVDFKFWGWGKNAGKKCRNSNNTGCDNTYSYIKDKPVPAPVYKNSSTPLSQKSEFKYPGKGKTEGLMCKNQDGTVCDASSKYNKNPYQYWGWGVHAGMKCKNPNNTGCDTTFGYAKK